MSNLDNKTKQSIIESTIFDINENLCDFIKDIEQNIEFFLLQTDSEQYLQFGASQIAISKYADTKIFQFYPKESINNFLAQTNPKPQILSDILLFLNTKIDLWYVNIKNQIQNNFST